MIDLSYYVNNIITNEPSIQQVIQPERVSLTTVDTSALLTGLLEPHVNNRVYAYHLPDNAVYPSITYEQTGGQREEVDGYTITKTDVFIVSIQTETLSDLISVIDNVRNSLITYSATGAAGGIEISDQAITHHNELQRYEAALEVRITHLSLPSQATPSYYIYPLLEKSDENQAMTGVIQLVTEQFVGLLVAQVPSNGVSGIASLRTAAFNQIINKSPTQDAGRTEHVQGNVAGLVGSIVIYRDVFSVTTTLQYC